MLVRSGFLTLTVFLICSVSLAIPRCEGGEGSRKLWLLAWLGWGRCL